MTISKAKAAEKAAAAKKRAKQDYTNNYNKKTYVTYSFRINRDTEYMYMQWISGRPEGVKEYLLSLVAKDMKAAKRRKKVINGETEQ